MYTIKSRWKQQIVGIASYIRGNMKKKNWEDEEASKKLRIMEDKKNEKTIRIWYNSIQMKVLWICLDDETFALIFCYYWFGVVVLSMEIEKNPDSMHISEIHWIWWIFSAFLLLHLDFVFMQNTNLNR